MHNDGGFIVQMILPGVFNSSWRFIQSKYIRVSSRASQRLYICEFGSDILNATTWATSQGEEHDTTSLDDNNSCIRTQRSG